MKYCSYFLFHFYSRVFSSGPCAYKTGALPLEAHLQSIFSGYFRDGELFAGEGLEPQSSQSQPSKLLGLQA
jgi:hypothetical protein